MNDFGGWGGKNSVVGDWKNSVVGDWKNSVVGDWKNSAVREENLGELETDASTVPVMEGTAGREGKD